MNIRLIIVFFLATVVVYGCGPNRMYNYGSYSNTLYDYRKDSTNENLLNHIKEMENIVVSSGEDGKRVPPGLFGEMGYMYLKNNDKNKAVEYFNREKALYPESVILMDRMIKTIANES